MSTLAAPLPSPIHYPDSDGRPMADNTTQFRWIMTIQGNLDLLFHSRQDVFVAGDNLWYPVQGDPTICVAPDVYVAFGRPKGDRGSYKQWEENDTPLAVVFEIQSPSNTFRELLDKFEFYQQHGVREYYIIDPEPPRPVIEIWVREQNRLRPRDPSSGWVSPLLGVRFVTTPTAIELYYPDLKPFLSFVELGELQKRTAHALETERQRAETERQRAETERQRAAKLAARLRELDIDPDAV
ncbi:MAG TPA: Uma2 family endonuclease [Gemmata sp.]|nr:Uma2 family endonuclease [Gemmata sp.]